MTIAPELPGAIDLIRRHHNDLTFAVGHTDDDGSHTRQAFDAGARTATHLFNATPPMTHRHPGPVGAALVDDRIACELIADGIHLSPEALTVATRTAGLSRSILITDAMPATGQGNGTYSYADRHVPHHYGWQNRGTLAIGNPADLVLLSADLTVQAVYLAGELITAPLKHLPS